MLIKSNSKKKFSTIDKTSFFYKIIFIMLGVLSTSQTLISSFTTTSNNNYQFLLPLVFTFCYLFLAPSINKLGLGYFILNLVWVMRYIIMPVLFTITGFSMPQVDEGYLLSAVFIMIIEMVITFMAVRFYYNKNNMRNATNLVKEKVTIQKNIDYKLILLFLFFSFLIILIDSNALNGFNFILDQEFSRRSGANFGVFGIFLNWTKYLLTIFLICYFGNKHRKKNKTIYLVLAVSTMVLSMAFFQGTSRNGILIEAIAYLAVLTHLFPKQKKRIMFFSFISIFVLMLSITLYRFYDTRDLSDTVDIFDLDSITALFNAYFSGQYNVAIGIKTLDLFWNQYSVLTILRDIFANTMVINNFVSDIPGTVEYFNYTYYNHSLWADQISPLITQTVGLFNIFGLFFPIIVSKIIVKMDMITLKDFNILGIFVATFFSTNIAFYSHGNLTIISTAILNQLLPLFLIYRVSSIKFKR